MTELSVVEEARQRAEDGCDTFTAFATAINEEQIPSYEELRLAAQSVKAAVGVLSVAVRRVETLEAEVAELRDALRDILDVVTGWSRPMTQAEKDATVIAIATPLLSREAPNPGGGADAPARSNYGVRRLVPDEQRVCAKWTFLTCEQPLRKAARNCGQWATWLRSDGLRVCSMHKEAVLARTPAAASVSVREEHA